MEELFPKNRQNQQQQNSDYTEYPYRLYEQVFYGAYLNHKGLYFKEKQKMDN